MSDTRHNTRRGFTLVELLVVIGIMAILVGLLFPAVNAARERARRVKASGEVRELEKVWRMYYRMYDQLPGNGTMTMDAGLCGELEESSIDGRRLMEMTPRQLADGMKDPWGQLYVVEFRTTGLDVTTAWYYTTRVYPANARR